MARYSWWAVIALGLAIFMVTIDMTIVAMALPTLTHAFHLSLTTVTWVSEGYLWPMTLALVPLGYWLSRYSPRGMFVAAVVGFGAFSALCGLSPAFAWLVGARVGQGIIAAGIAALGPALAAQVVKPHQRGRTMGIIGTLGPLGSVLGPGLGGWLLEHGTWRLLFWVNGPVSIVTGALAIMTLGGLAVRPPTGTLWPDLRRILGAAPFTWGAFWSCPPGRL